MLRAVDVAHDVYDEGQRNNACRVAHRLVVLGKILDDALDAARAVLDILVALAFAVEECAVGIGLVGVAPYHLAWRVRRLEAEVDEVDMTVVVRVGGVLDNRRTVEVLRDERLRLWRQMIFGNLCDCGVAEAALTIGCRAEHGNDKQ